MQKQITCPNCLGAFTLNIDVTPSRKRDDGRPAPVARRDTTAGAALTPQAHVRCIEFVSKLPPGAQATTRALYDAYCDWGALEGFEVLTIQAFGRELTAIGLQPWRSATERGYRKRSDFALSGPHVGLLFDERQRRRGAF